jgi:uncharacterized RDD family membrane protein YckC
VTAASYPGAGLGLPQAGRGAIAGMGRRVGAIAIDWLLSMAIAAAFITRQPGPLGNWTLVVFAVQDFLLTALIGLTVGKRLLSIKVTRLDGRITGMPGIGWHWALLRTVLLLTVVAPLITDRDLRGLHDRAANTAVVRL